MALPAVENEVVVAPNEPAPDLAATLVEAAPLVAPVTAPQRLPPSKQFIDTMYNIRLSQGLPCDYAVPLSDDGGIVDLARVNLDYRPEPDRAKVAPLWDVGESSQCTLDRLGWYYDDPALPQKIRLCDQTCAELKGDIQGEMNISVGCPTRLPPP